jgi:hypothetical protein
MEPSTHKTTQKHVLIDVAFIIGILVVYPVYLCVYCFVSDIDPKWRKGQTYQGKKKMYVARQSSL